MAYRITLCTQTRCCSRVMANLSPLSSSANDAPTSSHLQPRASSLAPPSPPPLQKGPGEMNLTSPGPGCLCCQVGLFSGCKGEPRPCLCREGGGSGWSVTDLVALHKPLSQALGQLTMPLRLGVGVLLSSLQKNQQGLGSASWDVLREGVTTVVSMEGCPLQLCRCFWQATKESCAPYASAYHPPELVRWWRGKGQ